MKAYRASKNYRYIPIGYSHADVQSIGQNLQNYWACTTPTEPASGMLDFYALNSYRWCGSNTFQGSGYSDIMNQTAYVVRHSQEADPKLTPITATTPSPFSCQRPVATSLSLAFSKIKLPFSALR